jgi:membrane associated rhomboid family serine protease
MAFPPPHTPATEDDEAPRLTPAVLWLVVLNVAIYFVQLTLLKDVPTLLGFQHDDLQNRALWTGVTYLFVHAGFWHLAVNMYMLASFGPRVERTMGGGAWPFALFYLWCGLGGVVAHELFVQHDALLMGASAAVLGVVLAYAMRWPDDEVSLFFVVPMRMRWVAVVMIAINLALGALSAPSGQGGGVAYLAHLGGVAFGLLYLLRPSAPSMDRLRQRVATAPDLGDEPPRPVPRSLPRPRERQSEVDEVVEQSKQLTLNKPPRPQPAPPPPRPTLKAASRREALDLVLDKISEHGLDSLTLEERHLLEEMSRSLRNG